MSCWMVRTDGLVLLSQLQGWPMWRYHCDWKSPISPGGSHHCPERLCWWEEIHNRSFVLILAWGPDIKNPNSHLLLQHGATMQTEGSFKPPKTCVRFWGVHDRKKIKTHKKWQQQNVLLLLWASTLQCITCLSLRLRCDTRSRRMLWMMRRRLFCPVSLFPRAETGQQVPIGSHQGPQEALGSQRIELTKTQQREIRFMSATPTRTHLFFKNYSAFSHHGPNLFGLAITGRVAKISNWSRRSENEKGGLNRSMGKLKLLFALFVVYRLPGSTLTSCTCGSCQQFLYSGCKEFKV